MTAPNDTPTQNGTETAQDLLQVPGLRIERIVSHGYSSPPGFWYEQNWDEWVMVLEGVACLRIEGREALLTLGPGDHCWLPAGCRHRIESTSLTPPTVWLTVHRGEGLTEQPAL